MKLAFYNNHPYWGGLQPNGGSRTILLSCAALRELGHEANVVTHTDRFKWFEHPKPWKDVPKDTDAVIAVAISDVKSVWKMKCKKAYWARPFETWQYKESKCINIMKRFEDKDGKILVNSMWQYEFMYDKGIRAYLIRAGIDFDKWRNIGIRSLYKTPTILCQYSSKSRKGYKQFKKLKKLAPEFHYMTFGKNKKTFWPQIVGVYNDADYFFIPNTHEGFYNCGAEAALCGCTLVVNDCFRNGCSDYSNSENSIVYRSLGEVVDRIRAGEFGNLEDVKKRLKMIGTRKECMQRLVATLESNNPA